MQKKKKNKESSFARSLRKKNHFLPLIFVSECLRVFHLNACLCTTCMPGAQREQKKVLDPWS